MRIRWTPAAADDLETIADYVSAHWPAFAKQTVRTIYQAIQDLKVMPHRGRMGRAEGTRELVIPDLPYMVVYRLKNDSLEILRIYHASQRRES